MDTFTHPPQLFGGVRPGWSPKVYAYGCNGRPFQATGPTTVI